MKRDLKKLQAYYTEILEMYKDSDDSHGVDHIKQVCKNADKIIDLLNDDSIDGDIIIAACILHDIGIPLKGRKDHEKTAYEFIKNDKTLLSLFTEEEIEIIAKACLEHRASYKGGYTSIYSKIVSDADRDDNLPIMISRSYQYTSSNNPDLTEECIYTEVYNHLKDKYGFDGYSKFNLDVTYEIHRGVKSILANENIFKSIYKTMR